MESGAVVAPPYLARPLRLAPFHALRLPPRRVGDPGTMRQLARAARTVGSSSWRERVHLLDDGSAGVYLHEYTTAGLTVRGLVGALDLSRRARDPQDSAVLPHEGIRPVQADDLADRMAEIGLNPAPILLVHRAEPDLRTLVRRHLEMSPDHEFTDRREQHHRIWQISDPDDLAGLDEGLLDSQALIADGHHRYAAYLRMQSRQPGGPADYGLAMLVDQEETPLFLGPIHRVLTGIDLDDVVVAADATGHRGTRAPRDVALSRLAPTRLVATDGQSWAVLQLRVQTDSVAAVQVLHDDLLPALPRGPQEIDYLHSVGDALKAVRRSHRVALLMPAPDVDQILRVAATGRLLPHKATSFQPKPNAGALIRSLRDE